MNEYIVCACRCTRAGSHSYLLLNVTALGRGVEGAPRGRVERRARAVLAQGVHAGKRHDDRASPAPPPFAPSHSLLDPRSCAAVTARVCSKRRPAGAGKITDGTRD